MPVVHLLLCLLSRHHDPIRLCHHDVVTRLIARLEVDAARLVLAHEQGGDADREGSQGLGLGGEVVPVPGEGDGGLGEHSVAERQATLAADSDKPRRSVS